jgi:hypothetical protein
MATMAVGWLNNVGIAKGDLQSTSNKNGKGCQPQLKSTVCGLRLKRIDEKNFTNEATIALVVRRVMRSGKRKCQRQKLSLVWGWDDILELKRSVIKQCGEACSVERIRKAPREKRQCASRCYQPLEWNKAWFQFSQRWASVQSGSGSEGLAPLPRQIGVDLTRQLDSNSLARKEECRGCAKHEATFDKGLTRFG